MDEPSRLYYITITGLLCTPRGPLPTYDFVVPGIGHVENCASTSYVGFPNVYTFHGTTTKSCLLISPLMSSKRESGNLTVADTRSSRF